MQPNLRLPAELRFSERDIGLSLLGIVAGQRFEDKLRTRSREFQDLFCEVEDRKLDWITEIDRSCDGEVDAHKFYDRVDQIIYVAERARLLSLSIDRDRLSFQRLDDEIRDNSAIVGMHAGTISVEDACHLDRNAILPEVVKKERFSAPFALIVAGAKADWIDITPVALFLGMLKRIAVDFACGSLENFCIFTLCKSKHLHRTKHVCADRLHRIMLIVDGRGGAGEIVDLIHFKIQRLAHISFAHFEVRIFKKGREILSSSSKKIIEADNR